MKLVIVQIAIVTEILNCSYSLHTCAKAFAQINKKFKSDVNDKLIVQRSELIVSGGGNLSENWAKAIEKNCSIKVNMK